MNEPKKLSILGDSISTYRGISDDPSVNATLVYNPSYYKPPFPVEKTYFSLVLRALGWTLCVNNSYSGGTLCGSEESCAGVFRAKELSRENGETPDVILIFMGINDLGRGVDVERFGEAYTRTLHTLRERYPDAAICCVNIPDRHPTLYERTCLFNEAIERAVGAAGERVFIADLFHSRMQGDFYYDNTTDGLHPDEDGMRYIAETVLDAIRSNM